MALTQPDIDAIVEAVWAKALESLTAEQIMQVMLAATSSKLSGGNTATITFRDNADLDSRIVADVDQYGNRSGVLLDVS